MLQARYDRSDYRIGVQAVYVVRPVWAPAGPSRPPDSLTHSTHFEYNALLCAHCVGAVPLEKTWSISFCPLHPVAKCLLSGDKKVITPCKSNKGPIWTTTHLHTVVLLISKSSFVLITGHRMVSMRISFIPRLKSSAYCTALYRLSRQCYQTRFVLKH